MNVFFNGLLDDRIIEETKELLANLDRSKLRSLKSNLRLNEQIRNDVNSRKISVQELINLPSEELACTEIKKRREEEKRQILRETVRPIRALSKDEIDILINKVEDP